MHGRMAFCGIGTYSAWFNSWRNNHTSSATLAWADGREESSTWCSIAPTTCSRDLTFCTQAGLLDSSTHKILGCTTVVVVGIWTTFSFTYQLVEAEEGEEGVGHLQLEEDKERSPWKLCTSASPHHRQNRWQIRLFTRRCRGRCYSHINEDYTAHAWRGGADIIELLTHTTTMNGWRMNERQWKFCLSELNNQVWRSHSPSSKPSLSVISARSRITLPSCEMEARH